MKKFFIGLGIFFVLAGIVFCAADTKDTSARAQALYDAPVVTMQDLEEWKNQDTQQEVVVTQIPLTGDLVSDPRKFLDGQFYYLKVEKWVYQKEEDEDSSGWKKEDDGSYTVRGDHVAAALDDQTELTEDNVRGLEWLDEFYPGGENGDTRYQIWGLGEDAQLTAVALVGNGEVTVQKPSEGHAYLYFYGTEDDFYQYVEDFVEGDSFLLLIVGCFLAAICFGIAWLLRGHKASGNIFIMCAASVVAQKQAYQQLNDVEKLRFWGLKIAAIPLEIGGFAAIWTHSDSTVWIAVGTVLLIFGVAAWMGSSAGDEDLEDLEEND